MKEIHRKLEIAANIAIIVAATVLVGGIAARYFSSHETSKTLPDPIPRRSVPDKQARFPLVDFDLTKSEKHLVLAFSTRCRFCRESTDLYRRIAERKAQKNELRLIVVSYQPIDEVKSYFKEKAIDVDGFVQSELAAVSISGTPTLVLVGADGSVVDSWVGKLLPDAEEELMARLFGEQKK